MDGRVVRERGRDVNSPGGAVAGRALRLPGNYPGGEPSIRWALGLRRAAARTDCREPRQLRVFADLSSDALLGEDLEEDEPRLELLLRDQDLP